MQYENTTESLKIAQISKIRDCWTSSWDPRGTRGAQLANLKTFQRTKNANNLQSDNKTTLNARIPRGAPRDPEGLLLHFAAVNGIY